MTLRAAHDLWGPDVVRHALADDAPDAVDDALLDAIAQNADPPGRLRAWSLAQPWPRFCAVVRVVSGEITRDVTNAK